MAAVKLTTRDRRPLEQAARHSAADAREAAARWPCWIWLTGRSRAKWRPGIG